MAKYSSADIRAIAKEMRARPFSLLTGAGVSLSAGVPLAGDLVKQIAKDPSLSIHIEKLKEDEKKNYGLCMGHLPINVRKEFLRDYLNKVKVNWAHIAIASMMDKGYVNRVLTFNFDNVLAKACGLCGLFPATYDFVTGVSVNTDHLIHPCIIHLHGQGAGLSMLNSNKETEAHAKKLVPLIRNTMDTHPLLVIGYSGLSDRLFDKIYKWYVGKEKLHWCNHSEEPQTHVAKLIIKHQNLAKHYGGADADIFLLQLAQELNCFPPVVFSNPLTHVKQMVKDVCNYPISENATDNALENLLEINVLKNLLEMIEKLENSQTDKASGMAIRFFLKGQYKEISNLSTQEIRPELLSSANFAEGLEIFNRAGGLDGIQKVKLLKRAIEKFTQAISQNHIFFQAYYSLGTALIGIGKLEKNEKYFLQAIDNFKQALQLNPKMNEAYNNWGNALIGLGDIHEEPKLYFESIEKFKEAIKINPEMSEAYLSWGNALLMLGLYSNDLDMFYQASQKYKKSTEIRADNFGAFNGWALALVHIGKITKDIQFFEIAFSHFKTATEIRPGFFEAYSNWGRAYGEMGIITKDRTHFEQSFKMFEKSNKTKPNRAETLNNWAHTIISLASMTKNAKLLRLAIDKLNRAIAFNPKMTEAYYNLGVALRKLGELSKDKDLIGRSIENFRKAISVNPKMFGAYFGLGDSLVEWGILLNDHSYFVEANKMFQQSYDIKPQRFEPLSTWGNALIKIGKFTKDKNWFSLAYEKFCKASNSNPKEASIYNNWVAGLLAEWHLTSDPLLLEQAGDFIQKAILFEPKFTYNAACLAAIKGDHISCQSHLKNCLANNTLPSRKHLIADNDFENVRNQKWFTDFIQQIPEGPGRLIR